MTTEFGVDGSPTSPSKPNIFPFLSANDTGNQRRPKTIGQITKTFSSFSFAPNRQGYKPTNKGKLSNATTRTPSIASEDSDDAEQHPMGSGKVTLRVINPDPPDYGDDGEVISKVDGDSEKATTTRPDDDVTPTNSVLGHDTNVSATTTTSNHIHTHSNEAPQPPTVDRDELMQQPQPQPQPSYKKQITIPTIAPRSTLVRRQSKTLDEIDGATNNSELGLLPPLDLTPFDSSNLIPISSSDLPHTSFIRLSTIVEPAPALATPFNATPTSPQASSLIPNTSSQPQPSISTNTMNTHRLSVSSFDRNTLSSLPGDAESTTTTATRSQFLQTSNQLPTNAPYLTTPNFGKSIGDPRPTPSVSKYAKASYSLTNNPDALRLYRDMAKKTKDKTVQYSYAKYLLEIAALYDQGRETKHNRISSLKHSFGEASQRLRHELNQVSRHTMDRHPKNRTSPQYANVSTMFAGSPRSSLNLPSTRPPSLAQSVHASRTHALVPPPQPVPPSPTATASVISTTTNITSATTTTAIATAASLYAPSTSHQDNASHRRKKRALEEEGIRWMKRLAKENMPDAAFTIATWMEEAKYGFTCNPGKSFALYEIAARNGIRDAIYKMGLYYESMDDPLNALKCFKEASELGVVHATLKLAKIYLHGELSQRQNMTLAISTLHQATNDADESCPEPPYMFGLILTNTYPKADIPSQVVQQYGGVLSCLPYFERAVHLGYPPAHSTLGSILEQGLYGLRVNYAQCYIHYSEAAKRGDAQGMVGLSRLDNRGYYGPNDSKDFHQKLALDESGWLAQREPDEENAFYWCQKAAQQELPEAEFLLGWYYDIGLGTVRDHEKSQWYYLKAAASGHEGALQHLNQEILVNHASTIGLPAAYNNPSVLAPKGESQQCVLM